MGISRKGRLSDCQENAREAHHTATAGDLGIDPTKHKVFVPRRHTAETQDGVASTGDGRGLTQERRLSVNIRPYQPPCPSGFNTAMPLARVNNMRDSIRRGVVV